MIRCYWVILTLIYFIFLFIKGKLNDLWSYSIKDNEWTWLSGSDQVNQYGVYGKKGIPSKENTPGSRSYGSSWFDSKNKRLWLFGGLGYSATKHSSKYYILSNYFYN